ncbi:MAG: hypothetical protein AAF709_19020, partial [Pseudomonadota bacterium]
ATDDASTKLRSRTFRLAVSPSIDAAFRDAISSLQDPKTNGPVAQVCSADDPALLLDGEIDALLRTRISSHPGLHLDDVVLKMRGRPSIDATLALLPGTNGCREHSLLLAAIRAL